MTHVFCVVFMLYIHDLHVHNSQVVLFISVFYHTALSQTRSCPVTEASLWYYITIKWLRSEAQTVCSPRPTSYHIVLDLQMNPALYSCNNGEQQHNIHNATNKYFRKQCFQGTALLLSKIQICNCFPGPSLYGHHADNQWITFGLHPSG